MWGERVVIAGITVNFGVTPTMNAAFTANPDFAQVEADQDAAGDRGRSVRDVRRPAHRCWLAIELLDLRTRARDRLTWRRDPWACGTGTLLAVTLDASRWKTLRRGNLH